MQSKKIPQTHDAHVDAVNRAVVSVVICLLGILFIYSGFTISSPVLHLRIALNHVSKVLGQ